MWMTSAHATTIDRNSIDRLGIYIVGAGAETCVGRGVLPAAAAVRCGISRYADHGFMIDRCGEPMVVARAGWLDEDLPVPERIVSLALGAARESLLPIEKDIDAVVPQLRIHVALDDESLPDPSLRAQVIAQFAHDIALGIDGLSTQIYEDGHAAGVLALERACQELRTGKAGFCLVGGSDSLLAPDRLQTIDRSGRLHSKSQTWGFTPGEGAGFCLLAMGAAVREHGLLPLGRVFSVATARESNTLGTDTVCTGEALTEVFRGVLDSTRRVSQCYCDLNGEPYRANEYGFAIGRTAEYFENPANFTTAAACWGDVGCASAILALTLPIAGWSRGYGPAAAALIWASGAHAPLRGAVLLGQVAGREVRQ